MVGKLCAYLLRTHISTKTCVNSSLLALISEVQPQRHRSIEIELKRRVKRKGFKRDRMSSDMSFVFLTQSAERLSLYVMI